jgi:hypothetical protein
VPLPDAQEDAILIGSSLLTLATYFRRSGYRTLSVRRGYLPGLIPDQPPSHAGMEAFMLGFLEDFSKVSFDPAFPGPAATSSLGVSSPDGRV